VKLVNKRKGVFAVTLVSLLCFACPVEAQKDYRIGALVSEDQFVLAFDGFKKKMAEFGYTEGKNVKYDLQNAKGDIDALKKLAQKIVQEKPDLIVTSSTTATLPVAKLTEGTNLPVVFLGAGDPLKLVKSYASSGNNLTGINTSNLDLTEKQFELFKELVPGMKRVIFLNNPNSATYAVYIISTREAAKRMGFVLAEIEVRATNAEQVKQQISPITHKLGDGLFIPPDATIVATTEELAQQAIKEKLPTLGPNVQTVKRGLLAAYSSDYYSLGHQGAAMVDKILKGSRPTDLPIEQPSKLSLAVNLKTAKAIGVKIPKEILLRADDVVE
jgi:putative ABC transport system substrate-binding protein